MAFPGVPDIEIADRGRRASSTPRSSWSAATWRGPASRASSGSSSSTSITIPGNTGYGQINWFDADGRGLRRDGLRPGRARSACRCRSRSRRTSTSRSSPTPARSTTRASRRGRSTSAAQALEAGVDPVLVARNVYDSNNMGRLKLFGAVLSAMQIDATGRIAIVYLDHEMARAAGGTYEDTEGLINLPLTVKEIQAVVFFKQIEGDEYRVSMRSKGDIDIGAVAKEFGGGGHKNAAGCTVTGPIDALQKTVRREDRARDRIARRDAQRQATCRIAASLHLRWTVSSSSTSRSGPTSHDVVARVRRVLGERRIGHTGTLDPAASGVLPLVLGRATRLARFLSASDKTLRGRRPARRRDRHRRRAGTRRRARRTAAPLPSREAIERGARRVPRHVPAAAAGVLGEEDRRHAAATGWRARRATARHPAPSPVRRVRCPLPAPVTRDRALPSMLVERRRRPRHAARRLLRRLLRPRRWRTTWACGSGPAPTSLALRRTRSGDFTLDDAMALDALEREPARWPSAPRSRWREMLPALSGGHADARRGPARGPRARPGPGRHRDGLGAPRRPPAGSTARSSGCSTRPAIWSAIAERRQGVRAFAPCVVLV